MLTQEEDCQGEKAQFLFVTSYAIKDDAWANEVEHNWTFYTCSYDASHNSSWVRSITIGTLTMVHPNMKKLDWQVITYCEQEGFVCNNSTVKKEIGEISIDGSTLVLKDVLL